MEELSIIGERHKRILVTFLKVNNAYASFIKNAYEERDDTYSSRFSSSNNRFNVTSLAELFKTFFSFELCKHPSTIISSQSRYNYWRSLYYKWIEFCYYQKYKYIYNI